MKTHLWMALEWLCRLVVAAVFLLAAFPKILDPAAFAVAVRDYRVVMPVFGQDYVYLVANFLPALEAVAAVALLINRFRRAGALLCGLMNLMFIILISQATIRGFNIDCGCFGTGAVGAALAQKVGVEKVLEDVLWLAMCVVVWVMGRPKRIL